MVVQVEEEVAAQVADMASGQWKTQSETFREVVYLREHLEQVTTLFLGDARARILEDKVDLRPCLTYVQ